MYYLGLSRSRCIDKFDMQMYSVVIESEECTMSENVRYYRVDNKKKKGSKKPVVIFLVILIAVIMMGWLLAALTKNSDAAPKHEHITILHVEGTIQPESYGSIDYSQDWMLEQIEDARLDDNNKGLILFINTPGGTVYETDEVYLELLEYKETGKPYYVAMGAQATSGGYYMAAPADRIYANRNCWTGSIGVTMGTFYDISGLLDKYGIETETITSGDNKAMGSTVEPMTKEQKAIFQSLVDEAYDQFVGIVADGRNMSVKEVKKLADGRIYTAQQALDNGLIDEIGTLEDAVSGMMAEYDLHKCEENELVYEDDSFWRSVFAAAEKKSGTESGTQGDIAALVELMKDHEQMPVMYMPAY